MPSEAVINVLTRTRDLFYDRSRWTRDRPARNTEGQPVSARDDAAVCWCLTGAFHRFAVTDEVYRAAVGVMKNVVPPVKKYGSKSPVADFNDVCTHAEMLAALDAAIALEQESQT